MTRPKRVAVIGAGPSGLTAIKSCKEVGYDPVCYERNGEPGGLWRYHDEDIEGVASVMKSTIINTGKERSAFSDFPPPKEYPNYMHNTMMHKYFMLYAENFDLLRHIRYHLEVVKIEQTQDYEETGRWVVTVKSLQTEAVTKEEFDAVMVCIGHHVFPNMPTFPGQEKFDGILTHTHSVKRCTKFEDKRVVVVGIGNSGADAAVACSHVSSQVYLSTRRGSWILSRVGINGRPYDMDASNRMNIFLNSFRSFDSMCEEMEKKINAKFDHEAYNLKPKHRVFSAHPTMNDSIPNCILSGRIIVKGNIKRFEEKGVVFDGENNVTEADVVIFATGYHIKFPFLTNVLTIKENKIHLYKYSIPPFLKHHTLALIGLIQPLGSLFPISEMQSRWFMQVLRGNLKLPPASEMEESIQSKNASNAKRYVDSTRHTIQVDWLPFMDELASEIGAKPNFLKLAITDPKLFSACFFGPVLAYQYRIQGPHAWPGARKALLEYESRVFAPLNPHGKVISKEVPSTNRKKIVVFLLITAVGVYYANKNLVNINDVIFNWLYQ